MRRILLMGLFLSAIVILLVSAGRACSCDLDQSNWSTRTKVHKAKATSAAVFSGKVIEINENPTTGLLSVRLLVTAVWKGREKAEIAILTGRGNGDCGYPFEMGKEYLVYAYSLSNGELSTNICQRTALLEEVKSEIRFLGNKIAIEPGETKAARQTLAHRFL